MGSPLRSLNCEMDFVAFRIAAFWQGEHRQLELVGDEQRPQLADQPGGGPAPLAFSLATTTVPGARLLKRRQWSIH